MKNILIIIPILALLTGCMQEPKPTHTPSVKNMSDVTLHTDKDGNVNIEETHTFKDGNISTKTETLVKNKPKYEVVPNFDKDYKKNLALKNKKKSIKKITVRGSKVKLSVEAIPINEFIDLVFANTLKLNYTVSADVRALKMPITLNMPNLQPKQQLFDVVSKLLAMNGVGVKKENGVLFIQKRDVKNKIINSSDIYISYGRSVSPNIADDKKILLFVPYNYINGGNVPNILRQMGMTSIQFYYTIKGIQMMKGKAGDIRQALSIVDLVDRPFLSGKSIYLINLKEIEATKFVSSLKSILPVNGITISSNPSKNGLFLLPIKELNSVLIVSSKKSWLDTILYWKNKLDVVSERSPLPRFYLYKVKNRKADELAKALNSVIKLKFVKNIPTGRVTLKTKNKKTKKQPLQQITHTIEFDLATNTLMMKMLPSEHRELLPIIKKLDQLPLQVLVEVTMAEVTLTDEFSLGFEYALRNGVAAKGAGSPLKTITKAAFGGSGFVSTYNSTNLDATINALASNKLLSIMSRPKLLILNNKTGNINVGSQIPVITSEVSTQLGGNAPAINRNVTYRNTGVQVGLSPTINSNGVLTIKIMLNLSEAQLNSTSGIDSPLIVNRSLSTSMTLQSGSTVLIGGLISKNKSTSDGGVPYLMDIPWLGNIFKNKSTKTVKTELIMLIKPQIIKNITDMNKNTQKYKKALKILSKYSLL